MTATTRADAPFSGRTDLVAFVSPSGGSGQTSLAANTAWTLAAAGHRVLILDWGSTPPLVGHYLRLPVGQPEVDAALDEALDVLTRSRPTGAPARLNRYALPRDSGGGSVDIFAAHRPGQPAPELPIHPGAGATLRRLFRQTGYDYVLIDCPAPPAAASLTQLAHLCDSIVVCFRSHHRVLAGAVDLARALAGEAQVQLRLVAVQTQIGQYQDQDRTAEQIRQLREAFAQPPIATGADNRIELRIVRIPQHSYDLDEERLAILLDEGEMRRSLLEIVEVISAGVVTGFPPVDPRVLDRYRLSSRVGPVEPTETIYLAYDPLDRRWADWVAEELRQGGANVAPLPADDSWMTEPEPAELVLIGHRLLGEERIRGLVRRAVTQAGAERPRMLRIQVEEQTSGTVDEKLHLLDLSRENETHARGQLLTHFGMMTAPDSAAGGGGGGPLPPRYPGRSESRRTPICDLPVRSPQFIGRATDLEALRDRLLAAPAGPQILAGPAGVGKSELVREYAHRFADDYDLAWWIAADSRDSIHAALSQLGRQMRLRQRDLLALTGSPGKLSASPPEDGQYGSVLAALADPIFSRHLLIYDNLEDPSCLDLLPTSSAGHILVTSRQGVRPAGGQQIPVGRLQQWESVALLQEYVPDLTDADARAVAAAVEHLPLTLRMAGAWLREQINVLLEHAPATALATAATAATLLRERVEGDSEDAPAASTAALRRTWNVLRTSLWQTSAGRLAVRLAELAVYLSADRVSLKLLRSGPMVTALLRVAGAEGDQLAADPVEFDRVLWTGVRFGVFDLTWGSPGQLRIHHALRDVIRDGMTATDSADRQREVRLALARYAPGITEDDDPEQRARLAELQHHLLPSGAVDSADREVRRWVTRQVRYMQLQQVATVQAAALDIADTALRAERETVAADDPTRMWLETERANILRGQGHYEQAHAVDADVRRRQTESQGVDHLRTLITTRGLAGDLRAHGRYDGARGYDSLAYDGFRRALGEEHQHTLMAAHNFALSSYLDGDVHIAMVTARGLLERRLRLFGSADPNSWWAAASLGTYQRELGDLAGATETLSTAMHWIREHYGAMPPDNSEVLRVARELAATRRWQGLPELAKQDDAGTMQAYRRLLRDDHPATWACRLALAADHHALGESLTAVNLTRLCLTDYSSPIPFGPDHPFTAICRMNLAVYLRGAGRLAQALSEGELAWRTLRDTLSSGTHPWILAAMINQAGHLAASGNLAEALDLARRAAEWCRDDLPVHHPHPYTAAAVYNVRLIEAVRAGTAPTHLTYKDLDVDVPQV